MAPLRRQSVIFLQSRLTEELASDAFCTESVIGTAFHEDTSRLFGDVATILDYPPAFPADRLLPSFEDDNLGQPCSRLEEEHFNFPDVTVNTPINSQLEDLFDPACQALYREMFHLDLNAFAPPDVTGIYETAPQAPAITFTDTPSWSPTFPVDPSIMSAYAPCFDYSPQSSPLSSGTVPSPPPTSPSVSSFSSSESDDDGDYVPPSDDDMDYRRTQPASCQRQKKRRSTSQSKSPRPKPFPSPRSSESESDKSSPSSRGKRRSHPYKFSTPSRNRNFQYEDVPLPVDAEKGFQCTVPGCHYAQSNERVPELKRHIETHTRCLEPERWICCGVSVDKAHLYEGSGITQGMTDEECIKAGAIILRGRLMIGGCSFTFSRRDALKRHIDNKNKKKKCIGDMDSYDFHLPFPF